MTPPARVAPAEEGQPQDQLHEGETMKALATLVYQPQEPALPASESPAARLTRLRTTGFRKLRDGRIHVRCYSCGRKVSNTVRMEYDPPTAVVIETPCEKCGQGSKEPPSYYYDATGAEVEEPPSYCADCGCYLEDGMIPRSARDPALCAECSDDDAADSPPGAPVPELTSGAAAPSRSIPQDVAAPALTPPEAP